MASSISGAPDPAGVPVPQKLVRGPEPEPSVTSTPGIDTTTPATERPTNKQQDEPDTTATESQAVGDGEASHTETVDVDKSKPEDFDGEVKTTNELPSAKTLKDIEGLVVLDKDGKTRSFGSLYRGSDAPRRVLVIFIRHFFCGNCQEYLRTLAESITPEALERLPTKTGVVVVGCGDPALIEMYTEATGCRFPIYTDPTRALFDKLGMNKTLALGSKPAYMRKSMWRSALDSVFQGLRVLPKGLALKSGDQRQVGGEFLFEPLDLGKSTTAQGPSGGADGSDGIGGEDKKVTWCHRMRSTRDHAEIPVIMNLLGLKG